MYSRTYWDRALWSSHFSVPRPDSRQGSAVAAQADTAVIRSAEISSCVVFPDSGRFTSRALHICISVLLRAGAGREGLRLFSNTHTVGSASVLLTSCSLMVHLRTCHSSCFGEACISVTNVT